MFLSAANLLFSTALFSTALFSTALCVSFFSPKKTHTLTISEKMVFTSVAVPKIIKLFVELQSFSWNKLADCLGDKSTIGAKFSWIGISICYYESYNFTLSFGRV